MFKPVILRVGLQPKEGEVHLSEKIDIGRMSAFFSLLRENTKLSLLNGSNLQMIDDDAKAFAEHCHLPVLDLHCNLIGEEGAIALASNSCLRRLWLSDNPVTDAAAQAFANNNRLLSLEVSGTSIRNEGAAALARNGTLVSLGLAENGLLDSVAIAFANNHHLTYLNLSGNFIGIEGARSLVKMSSLRVLNLSSNALKDEGVRILAQNTYVTRLYVSWNSIGDNGAIALASNTSLIFLDISSNHLGIKGAKALARNTSLTTLMIERTKIGCLGAMAFINNFNLTKIQVSWKESAKLHEIDNAQKQLDRVTLLNQKAKELRFIQQVIEVARGSRGCQERSPFVRLPSDIIMIILLFVGGDALRKSQEVSQVCLFLLATFRTKTKFTWRLTDGKTQFFQRWNVPLLEEVNRRNIPFNHPQANSSESPGCSLV